MSEWGNPSVVMRGHREMNKIVSTGGTRGSETSKYPEEKKENSITSVVASEEVRGQTMSLRTHGVAGRRKSGRSGPKHSGKDDRRG